MSELHVKRPQLSAIAQSPSLILLANIVVGALGLLTVPVLARGIGADGRGITAAAGAAFAVVPICVAFGMPLALRRRALSPERDAAVRSYRDVAILGLLPSAVIAGLLVNTVFDSLGAATRGLIAIGVGLAPLTISWMGDASVLAATGAYFGIFVLRVAAPLITLGVAVVSFLMARISVELVLLAQIAGSLTTFALGLMFVRVSFRGQRGYRASLATEGTRYAGAAIAEAASYRLDQLLLIPIIGAAQTGLYSIAVAITSIVDAVGQALGAPYYRRVLVARTSSERRESAKEAATAAISLAITTATLVGVLFIPTLPALLGDAFGQARWALGIALLGSVVLVVARVLSSCLAADGRGEVMTAAQLAGLGLGLGCMYALAPLFGASGAAMGSSLGYLLCAILTAVALGVRPRSWVPTVSGVRRGFKRMMMDRG